MHCRSVIAWDWVLYTVACRRVLDVLVNKPTNVHVLGVSSTSLRVMWLTADTSAESFSSSSSSSSSAASYYRVFYYDVNDLMSAEMNVTVEQQSAVIRDLCPFCEYNVRVVAYTVNGASVSSDEVTGRTLSDGQFTFFSAHHLTTCSYLIQIKHHLRKTYFLINWPDTVY